MTWTGGDVELCGGGAGGGAGGGRGEAASKDSEQPPARSTSIAVERKRTRIGTSWGSRESGRRRLPDGATGARASISSQARRRLLLGREAGADVVHRGLLVLLVFEGE